MLAANVREFDPDTITEKMLSSQHNWNRVAAFITNVLKLKLKNGCGRTIREGKRRRGKKEERLTYLPQGITI